MTIPSEEMIFVTCSGLNFWSSSNDGRSLDKIKRYTTIPKKHTIENKKAFKIILFQLLLFLELVFSKIIILVLSYFEDLVVYLIAI